MTDYTIRLSDLDDAAIIITHRNRMFEDADRGTEASRAQMDSHFEPWLRRHLSDGSYLGWFACDGDQVVAGAGLWLMDWTPRMDYHNFQMPYLLNVYTEPDYRKQGLARRLVNESIQYCREQGYTRMRLHASIYGRPLYDQLGFVANNEMQLVFD